MRILPSSLRERLRNTGVWSWVRTERGRAQLWRRRRAHVAGLQLQPINRDWGWSSGLPIDRYYIEQFLASHAGDIRGRVLEFGDDNYTVKFGGGRVTQSDVLEVVEGNSKATIVADLTHADHLPSDSFDCIICTQTLQMIFDMRAAVFHLHRILRPGGVLLATTHGISKISRRFPRDPWSEYWRLTAQSAQRLFVDVFQPRNVSVEPHGNVMIAAAFLYGVPAEELIPQELEYLDPDYEVLITIRAVKDGKSGRQTVYG